MVQYLPFFALLARLTHPASR